MEVSRAGSDRGLTSALSKRKKEEQAWREEEDASADLYARSKLLAAHISDPSEGILLWIAGF